MLSFSRQCRCFLFATLISLPSYRSQYKSRGNQRPARNFSLRPWHRQYWRLRNFHRMCIDYASRPRLSSRLTLRGRTFLKKPWAFDHYDSHIILATHSGILTPIQSTAASAATSPRIRRSPTTHCCIPSFGCTLSPVTFSAQNHSTSELLRTLLMSGCF